MYSLTMIFIPIIICFVPCILAFLIFCFKFKISTKSLFAAMLLGLISVLPISAIQYFLPDFNILIRHPILLQLLKSLLLYGFVEEAIKCLLLSPIPRKNKSALNYLLIAFLFGLTLGCFESVVYFLQKLASNYERGGELLYKQLFVRIFSSDIIHMTCAGLSGLFLYTWSQNKPKVSFFVIAILLHGIYDFFAGFQNGLKWFAVPVILLALIECRVKYTSISEN